MTKILLGAALAVLLCVVGRAAEKPNIILIVADDLGYGDLSAYGARDIQTPNIDRLGKEGALLTDFYVAALCTPSRAQMLTGRYPVRSGLVRVLFPNSTNGIEDSEVTVAQALRDAGYTTAIIGKWHLGHLAQFLPTRHGFDTWLGIPYSNDMTPTPLIQSLKGEDKQLEEPVHQDTLTRRYTAEAVRIIRSARQPFFIFLAHTMPHLPLAASADAIGKSQRGLYGDVVQELDWSVGEILRAVKETGLDRNTLVIFTSDNGPEQQHSGQGGSAGLLRAGKATVYEGGIRVPFVARWPGRIPSGRVIAAPAMATDFMPTFVKLAGGRLPNVALDGEDIMPMLTGRGPRAGSEFFFYLDGQICGMRSGNWKLLVPCNEKKRQFAQHNLELYELSTDLGEKNNLADRRPEIVEELRSRVQAFDLESRKGAAMEKR